jgi:hypothetical protein
MVELLEQNVEAIENAQEEDDEEAMMQAAERSDQEAPVICDILSVLASTKEGAEQLVKKSIDKKMFAMFDAARSEAEQAEDRT